MTIRLSTYIAFPGTTKEAFTHYHEVLGGELDLITYGDMPAMEGMPFEPDPESVAHVELRAPGGSIAGGDAMPGEEYNIRGSAYSLLYTLDTVEDAQEVIDRFLQAGGEMGMPFALAPWGDHYGQVFDKYGVMWAINVPGENPAH